MGLSVNGCCCCSLRTAGLAHGWFGIGFLIYTIIKTIFRIINFDNSLKPEDAIHQLQRRTLEQEQITLVAYIFDVLVSGLLIAGILKNKHLMLMPWLILRAIAIILAIPIGIVFWVLSIATVTRAIILASLIYFAIIGLLVWSWIVIYSLYKEIRNSKNRPMIPMQPAPLPYVPYYVSESGQLDPAPPYQHLNK